MASQERRPEVDDSDSDDDIPLSQRAKTMAPSQTPITVSASVPQASSVPAAAPSPTVVAKAAKKRPRAAAAAAVSTGQASKSTGTVSARAARTGAGGWNLNQAAGDLDVDYETLGVLGRGNFSEINLLRHRLTHELRALKFCCKLDSPSHTHLRAEATLASRVDHPFVLSPLAVVDSPGRAGNFSVLLPLCPGGDFLQLLRQHAGQRLSEDAARHYAAMIVLGLCAVHDAGLAYRDLKPENLLVRANGYLCIADFGFTAPLAECRRAKLGTPMYQAPELVRKLPHGVGVDWWAFGCLLVEMTRGSSPFQADTEEETEALILAHEAGVLPDGAEGAPVLSAALSDLCNRLLQPLPSERMGGGEMLRGHGWFKGFQWETCLAMDAPAPSVPQPLDPMDVDATLLELSRRCQTGFDC
jgi:serine/threonine protein kinase